VATVAPVARAVAAALQLQAALREARLATRPTAGQRLVMRARLAMRAVAAEQAAVRPVLALAAVAAVAVTPTGQRPRPEATSGDPPVELAALATAAVVVVALVDQDPELPAATAALAASSSSRIGHPDRYDSQGTH
jgi:hypothetical protein